MTEQAENPSIRSGTFPIDGMHCASCADTVEDALNEVEGVRRATVNPATEEVQIEYVEAEVSLDQLS